MKLLQFILILTLCFSCKTEKKEVEQEKLITTKEVTDVKLYSGRLVRIENFPTEFIKPRNVDIWLPEGYSEDKKYAVLYMHDGQMLFDASTTWNKQEWKVDEVASQLMKEGKVKDFIIVALWNISEIRWQDYYPQRTWDFIPKETQEELIAESKQNNFKIKFNADNYLKFITEDVKPFIDSNYSVFTDRENTFISGSSMGGLISMYAMFEYPEIFGGAACISTHWPGAAPQENNPMTKAFFDYMKSKPVNSETHKFYFDYGTETLDAHYPQYADDVDAVFKAKAYDASNYINLKFEGAAHDEVSWANRLDIPLTFLLGNNE